MFKTLFQFNVPLVLVIVLLYYLRARAVFGSIGRDALWIGLALFAGIQSTYVLNKALDVREDSINCPDETILPARRKPLVLVSTLIACLAAAYIASFPRLRSITAFAVVPTILYLMGGLKKNGFLKSPCIAVGFFLYIVVFPALMKSPLSFHDFWTLMLESWGVILTIFCLTVLLDVRDIEGDRLAGVKTIPVLLGHRTTIFLLVAALFLKAYHDVSQHQMSEASNATVFGLVSLFAWRPRPRAYFSAFLAAELAYLSFCFIRQL